jgi:AcrR family transcriptional regulator
VNGVSTSSRPKGDKRDRTRTRLLEAARSLIREKGYEHITLEEIAEKAGMTTGAIYGNFKNRNDLFIALGQTYWAPVRPRVKQGASFAEIMGAMAEATIAAIPERSAAAVGRLTGMAYAMTDEKLRVRVRETTAESYAFGEAWLRTVVKEEDLPMPAHDLVRVIHALTEGLSIQKALTPELVPDDVIRKAFAALGRK